MPSLRDTKNRIRSVKSTQQITKAMKLVAAAKLRRAQEGILSARPFAIKLMEVMNHLAARCNPDLHPLLDNRDGKKVLLVIVTSDRGLCGGFNTNIVKMTLQVMGKNPDRDFSLITAGKKGNDYFKSRDKKILNNYAGWTRDFDYLKAMEIGDTLSELFIKKEIDKVYMVYNEFKSVIQQEVILEQLLPIVPEKVDKEEFIVDYIYEPDEETILGDLLKRYMTVEVYRAFLESSASEHGSRMTAMDNATRNASEMIDDLTLFYNRSRQAYITKELIEVVNGAEALKG